MAWLRRKYGLLYHWLLDLFGHLKLSLFDGMAEALQKANEVRYKNLEKMKTDDAKENESAGKKQEYRNKKRENYGTEDKMYATHMVQSQMLMMMKLKTIDLLLQPLKNYHWCTTEKTWQMQVWIN